MYRLTPDRRESLRWFWNDCEAELGLRSNAGAVTDILSMGLYMGGGGRVAFDVMPERSERARRAAVQTHRCLQRMQREEGGIRHAGILYRVLGPYHWRSPFGHFKPAEIAPIIEDTSLITEMVETTGLTKSQAVEQCIRDSKRRGGKTLRRLEVQAVELLSNASRAYDAAYDAERAVFWSERNAPLQMLRVA